MQKQQLFFILGRERSGTTLLQNLLNNHAQIFIPEESAFIIFLRKKYASQKKIHIEEFVNDLYKEPYFVLWKIKKPELNKRLQQLKNQDFDALCKAVLNLNNPSQTAWVGDKNPVHSLYASELLQTFTEAKFIWIIRDYRAQVNSMLKVNFEQKNCTSLAIRWRKYNEAIEKAYLKSPEKFYKIRYEDFVTNSSEELQKICVFLNLDYQENMTENHFRDKPVKSHHQNLQKPLHQNAIASWKTGLNETQIKCCEHYAGKFGEKFDYQLSNPKTKFRSDFYGLFLGSAYVPLVKTIQKLPLNLKYWFHRKVIQPNFKFWKEGASAIDENSAN